MRGWIALEKQGEDLCESVKGDQEILLAVSMDGLDSAIAANVATGCQDGIQPKNSSH